MYIPPFTVSAEAINLIAEISGQIERYAITASTNVGQSGPFIDFMLNEIFKTLKQHQGESLPLASDSNPIDKEFGIKFGEEFGIKFGIRKDKNKKWKNWNRGNNGTCTSKNPFVRMIYTPMING